LKINPKGKCKGEKENRELVIEGNSDSDYAKDIENRKSISGYSVFVNNAPVAQRVICKRV
jgi:hypothetical protein